MGVRPLLLTVAGLLVLLSAAGAAVTLLAALPWWVPLAAAAGLALLAWVVRERGRRRLVVEVDLRGGAPESAGGRASVPGRVPLVRALGRAVYDDRVEAVVVRVGPALPVAAVEDLAEPLRRLRDAGTPTLAVADTLGQLQGGLPVLALAAACDRIVVQPGGEVAATGLALTRPYLRGLLDRLGVVPRIEGRHEWKSAAESVTRAGPSAEAAEEAGRLLSGTRDLLVDLVADGRGLDREIVAGAVANGPLSLEVAEQLGLIDSVGDPVDAVEALREGHDGRLVTVGAYASMPHGAWWRRRQRTRVALVTATGTVRSAPASPLPLAGRRGLVAEDVGAALRAVAKDDGLSAVVLRVSTPGGSAIASETLWQAVRACREAGTPVVVSMGDVCASGGYYLACGADRVVARAGTLTGSIGVVGGLVVAGPALERLGVTHATTRTDDSAGRFGAWEDLDDEGRAVFDAWLDRSYAQFTQRVAEGRGLDGEQVDAVARGRVWLGSEAAEVGLVDGVGGIELAVAEAARLLDVDVSRVDLAVVEPEDGRPWWARALDRAGVVVDARAWLPATAAVVVEDAADLAGVVGEPVLMLADRSRLSPWS